jgi:hypothetical protein
MLAVASHNQKQQQEQSNHSAQAAANRIRRSCAHGTENNNK